MTQVGSELTAPSRVSVSFQQQSHVTHALQDQYRLLVTPLHGWGSYRPAFDFFMGTKVHVQLHTKNGKPESSCIMSFKTALLNCSALAAIGLIPASGQSAVIWDEATQGDLSGDRTAPTTLTLSLGSNNLLATTQSGDLEYVTINVPAGDLLSSRFLQSYAGNDC